MTGVAGTKANRARTIQILEGILAPHIGPFMARASIRGHCQRLEIEHDEIEPAKVEQLIEMLGTGLAVFVGRAKAGEVEQAMHQAVTADGASS